MEKIWARLAREFAAKGHTVTLVSRKYTGLAEEEIQNRVRLIRKSGFNRTGKKTRDLILDLCYSLSVLGSLPKSKFIITNTFFLPILTGLVPKRFGKTVVSIERFPKGQLWLYSLCARLRTPSEAVRLAAVAAVPSCKNRIKRIQNPVDLRTFFPPRSHRPAARAGEILYAGRIHPEKGLHVLIGAFRILYTEFPDLTLCLLGPAETELGGGGENYSTELTGLAKGLPVRISPPTANPDELAERLRGASIFCYPSLAEKGESFGVAPLEAMATGLAPVVSALAVFQDLVEDGITGLIFDHRSVNPHAELAAKLRHLIVDDRTRDEMGQRAATKAHQFGYEIVAQAFLNDFSTLTNRRSEAKIS